MTTPRTPDGRITAQQNELDTLTYIHRFGWLRSRDLAALIWHDSKHIESGIAMAQRTLRRLKKAGQILTRIAPDGASVYALSESGARRLGDYCGTIARSGKDLLRELGNYQHRCNANLFAIQQINAGRNVWTEREIQANLAPIKVVTHKIPDGLVDVTDGLYAEGTLALAWLESERGYKKNSDFYKMMTFIYKILGQLDSQGLPTNTIFCAADGVYIEQVFIQIMNEKQLARIINAVRAEKSGNPYGYDWQKIGSQLLLVGLQGTSHPISRVLTEKIELENNSM